MDPLFGRRIRIGSREPGRWKKRLPGLLSFGITVLVMLMIFIGKGIYPFGDRSFLRTDLYHQYAPFFQELKDKLANHESLYYSWDIGLGTNFISIFGYYLSSPLNWLLYLCPRRHVIEFITYGIVLKMALSSLAMTWYLNKHNRCVHVASAFFGIFYGLSGYMAAYSWNIMWLDCMVLLPVIFWGVEKLIREDNAFLYCISLGLCILTNYYIAIMVCLGTLCYFIVQSFLIRGENVNYAKKIFNFTLFSLLAGGLSAVMLLPEVSALSYTASSNSSFPKSWSSYFTMFDMIARHLMTVQIEIGLDHWPNIYCGVGVLFFFPLYLCNKRVPFREKLAYGALLVFLLMSFSTNRLNFIWHGFHFPNSLPCRQSFIYIFLLLAMCYKGFLGLKARSANQLTGALIAAVAFVILAEKLEGEYTGSGDDHYYMWYSFYLSIGFLLAYGGVTITYRKLREDQDILKKVLIVLTAVLVTTESLINMVTTSVTTVSRTTYMEYDENVRTLVSNALAEEESGFVRFEKVRNRTKNDGAWLDYQSASIFSSTAYAELTQFYKKLGLESSTNAYGTTGSSLASNMLLGIRYSLVTDNDTKPFEDDFISLVEEADNVSLYRNTYALPIAFTVPDSLEEEWSTDVDDPGLNWNSLASSLGVPNLFTHVEMSGNGTSSVTLTIEEEGYYYVYPSKSGPGSLKVNADGKNRTYDNLSRNYFMPLGHQNKDAVTTITNKDSSSTDSINITAYRLNTDALAELYEKLNERPLTVTKQTSRGLSGTVEAGNAGTMVVTVAYDAGWRVLIDGKKVETASFKDAFLSFPVDAGAHKLELKYTPGGLYMGLAVTALSILLLILIWLFIRLWRENHPIDPEDEEEIFEFLPYAPGEEGESAKSLRDMGLNAPDTGADAPAEERQEEQEQREQREREEDGVTALSAGNEAKGQDNDGQDSPSELQALPEAEEKAGTDPQGAKGTERT